ncbi:MAG TPA: hypothetical protein VMB73_30075 [Acetobacteraceae bacterium]|nr:hypothetical protein [Acetobacteraceae bacterium]
MAGSECTGGPGGTLGPGAKSTVESKVAFHHALTGASGPVRAEGRIGSVGRRAAFAAGKLFDKDGRLCASGSTTCLVSGP